MGNLTRMDFEGNGKLSECLTVSPLGGGGGFAYLEELVSKENTILITDENVFAAHAEKFEGWKVIIIKAGEQYKQQTTVDNIIQQLIELQADRKTIIVGVGGGVVTDIAGYAASIYMRGLRFGFVPTSVLAMVDASIGGKNGVDVGLYKNLVGLIKQPEFLLFDHSLLKTLPQEEWVNGFAEIIKHACIKDKALFELLEKNTLKSFQQDEKLLAELIEKNVAIKTAVVVNDEFENGERKLLNFGHTFGHAIENLHQLPHGHAVSLGMVMAAKISEEVNNFYSEDKERVIRLLEQYKLPVQFKYDKEKMLSLLKMDKKREQSTINFILLNKIGEAVIKPLSLQHLEDLVNQIL